MASGKVIIIGAGIGGLSAGYWLSKRNYDVEILEADDRAGGRMVTMRRNGDRVDVGAQFYHSSYRLAFELMDAVGLTGTRRIIKGKVQFAFEDGSTFQYDHRVPYMTVLGLRGNLKLYWFLAKHLLLRRRFPLHQIVEDRPEYDNVESMDVFDAPSDKALRDFIVTTASIVDSQGLPEWYSLYHFLHTFRITSFTDYIGLTGGVASLAEKLAEMLPVQYESPVRRLVVEKGRVVGVQMESDGSVRRAGHVLVAVPPPAGARLMPEELGNQRDFFESVIYCALPMPVFFLDRPLRRDVYCYFNDPGQRNTFMFAVDETSKMPEMVPSGKSILTAWTGHPMSLDLFDQPDDRITRKAQQDMELMIPGVSQWIEDVRVFRHPYGVARYPTGSYRRVLEFKEQARQLAGVSFVSDLFGGSYMEPAMSSAAEGVHRVCGWGGMR